MLASKIINLWADCPLTLSQLQFTYLKSTIWILLVFSYFTCLDSYRERERERKLHKMTIGSDARLKITNVPLHIARVLRHSTFNVYNNGSKGRYLQLKKIIKQTDNGGESLKEERSHSMLKNERGQKEIERNKRRKEEVRREGKGEQGERERERGEM